MGPDEHVLEIGCGGGVAMELVCARLRAGRVTGLDRSAVAIARARLRLAAHLRAGRAQLIESPLADARVRDHFDKIFAVNVNLFWLDPRCELEVVGRLLRGGGRLYLFYEPPSSAQVERAVEACRAFLEAANFVIEQVLRTELPPNHAIGIIASQRSMR